MKHTTVLIGDDLKMELINLRLRLMGEKGEYISNSWIFRKMVKFVLANEGEFKKFLEANENGN